MLGPLQLPPVAIDSAHRRREWLALAAAATAHLAVLALLLPRTLDAPGEDGVALEAIAVSLVDSQAIISAPQAAPSDAREAPIEEQHQPSPPDQTAHRLDTPEPAKPDSVPEIVPPEPSPLAAPTRHAAEVERTDEKALVEHTKAEKPPAEATPPPTIAAAALPSQTSAEAAPGVVRAYAVAISRLLDRGKPRSHRMSGEVVINFVIDGAGRSEPPVVTRSSGNARLDASVLAAVERIEFPPPPPEMSRRQRTFIVPFKFR